MESKDVLLEGGAVGNIFLGLWVKPHEVDSFKLFNVLGVAGDGLHSPAEVKEGDVLCIGVGVKTWQDEPPLHILALLLGKLKVCRDALCPVSEDGRVITWLWLVCKRGVEEETHWCVM